MTRQPEPDRGAESPVDTQATARTADGSHGDFVVEPLASLELAREDWQRLAQAAGTPFATWEWAAAWWGVEQRGRLWLHACRTPGEERPWAILPLYVERERPLRMVRFLGNGVADEQGPICHPDRREAASAALISLLRDGRGRSVLLAERLPGEEPWGAWLGGRILAREASPVLEIAGMDWEEWLTQRSRNFRRQLRRRESRLRERHGLKLRLVEDAAQLDAGFETLCELYAARWGGGGTSFAGSQKRFHRAFVDAALERGWLRLWIAELEGAPAAAWLGYRYGGDDWSYDIGRDPRWNELGVGTALLMHAVRDAFGAGAGAFRLGPGGSAWKLHLSEVDPGIQTVVAGSAATLTPIRLAVAAAHRGPARLREALYRRYRV